MPPRSLLALAWVCPLLAACSVSESDADRTLSLPFWVSDEFTPSGYMGDGSQSGVITMHVDDASCHVRPADTRGSCFCFDYHAPATGSVGWGGVYFQAPPNNWGNLPGKRVAPGATEIHVKAAGVTGTELATFRVGGLSGMDNSGAPYPNADSFQAEQSFALTTELAEYVVPLPPGQTYDRVLGGFAWTLLAPADQSAIALYLDDVHWQ